MPSEISNEINGPYVQSEADGTREESQRRTWGPWGSKRTQQLTARDPGARFTKAPTSGQNLIRRKNRASRAGPHNASNDLVGDAVFTAASRGPEAVERGAAIAAKATPGTLFTGEQEESRAALCCEP
jgi:hypothetical protein